MKLNEIQYNSLTSFYSIPNIIFVVFSGLTVDNFGYQFVFILIDFALLYSAFSASWAKFIIDNLVNILFGGIQQKLFINDFWKIDLWVNNIYK